MKVEIKRKEEFFACMSHELRNPLNSLLGSLEVISGTKIINMDIMDSAQLAGKTLSNLIGNILNFSKIQNNKLEIYWRPTDLREKLINCTKIYHSLIEKKNIYIKYQIDPELPAALLIDDQKLNQVLINIIGNSIKFTEHGGIHINIEWYPLHGNISTKEIKEIIDTILSYSSRENLENFPDEMCSFDGYDCEITMPTDVSKYVFSDRAKSNRCKGNSL